MEDVSGMLKFWKPLRDPQENICNSPSKDKESQCLPASGEADVAEQNGRALDSCDLGGLHMAEQDADRLLSSPDDRSSSEDAEAARPEDDAMVSSLQHLAGLIAGIAGADALVVQAELQRLAAGSTSGTSDCSTPSMSSPEQLFNLVQGSKAAPSASVGCAGPPHREAGIPPAAAIQEPSLIQQWLQSGAHVQWKDEQADSLAAQAARQHTLTSPTLLPLQVQQLNANLGSNGPEDGLAYETRGYVPRLSAGQYATLDTPLPGAPRQPSSSLLRLAQLSPFSSSATSGPSSAPYTFHTSQQAPQLPDTSLGSALPTISLSTSSSSMATNSYGHALPSGGAGGSLHPALPRTAPLHSHSSLPQCTSLDGLVGSSHTLGSVTHTESPLPGSTGLLLGNQPLPQGGQSLQAMQNAAAAAGLAGLISQTLAQAQGSGKRSGASRRRKAKMYQALSAMVQAAGLMPISTSADAYALNVRPHPHAGLTVGPSGPGLINTGITPTTQYLLQLQQLQQQQQQQQNLQHLQQHSLQQQLQQQQQQQQQQQNLQHLQQQNLQQQLQQQQQQLQQQQVQQQRMMQLRQVQQMKLQQQQMMSGMLGRQHHQQQMMTGMLGVQQQQQLPAGILGQQQLAAGMLGQQQQQLAAGMLGQQQQQLAAGMLGQQQQQLAAGMLGQQQLAAGLLGQQQLVTGMPGQQQQQQQADQAAFLRRQLLVNQLNSLRPASGSPVLNTGVAAASSAGHLPGIHFMPHSAPLQPSTSLQPARPSRASHADAHGWLLHGAAAAGRQPEGPGSAGALPMSLGSQPHPRVVMRPVGQVAGLAHNDPALHPSSLYSRQIGSEQLRTSLPSTNAPGPSAPVPQMHPPSSTAEEAEQQLRVRGDRLCDWPCSPDPPYTQ